MNALDWILLIVIIAIIAAAVYRIWRNQTEGKSCCGCDIHKNGVCDGCRQAGETHERTHERTHESGTCEHCRKSRE